MDNLPPLALSVRQPWAWAILHGGKVIENRSAGSIRAGGMTTGTICLHAATGLTRAEYDWGVWRLAGHGVACPRPDTLVRRAIIGVVDVVDIVSESDSAWFGGQMGLVLENPRPIPPIPAAGALGYFRWERGGAVEVPKPWMIRWDRPQGDAGTGDLFDMEPSWRVVPPKPWSG